MEKIDIENSLKSLKNIANLKKEQYKATIDDLNKKLKELNKIKEYKESNNISFLYEIEKNLSMESPELKEKLEIIKYLYEKDPIYYQQYPQYKQAIEIINNSDLIKNNTVQIELIEKEIEKNNKCLNKIVDIILDKEIDIDFVLLLINDLELTEEEYIGIIYSVVYNSAPKKEKANIEGKIEEIKKTKQEENNAKEIEEKNIEIEFNNILSKYSEVISPIKRLIEENYSIINKESESYKNYKYFINIIKESKKEAKEKVDYHSLGDIDVLYKVLLINIFENIKNIDDYIKSLSNGKTPTEDDIEYIQMEIDEINELYNHALEILEEKINVVGQEKVEHRKINSNLIFIFDENDNINEEIYLLSPQKTKQLSSLFQKMESVDDIKTKRFVKYNSKKIPFELFVNYNSDIGCAYIRVDDENVIIINTAIRQEIFEESRGISIRYETQIKRLIDSIKNRNEYYYHQLKLSNDFVESIINKSQGVK